MYKMFTPKVAVFLLAASCAMAQQGPCRGTIPVNVIVPDGRLVRQLSPNGFVVHDKNEPVRIRSMVTDSAPRRIVFVAENAKSMPKAARKIESAVVSAILANARAGDSFAFISARGPGVRLPFGTSLNAIEGAARDLANRPQGKGHREGVLDAMLEARAWFQSPQPGDSILLLTMGLHTLRGTSSKASFSKVRSALIGGNVRVFGFMLGQFIAGYMETFPTPAMGASWSFASLISPNAENVFSLAKATGGLVYYENTDSQFRMYKLTDERLKAMKIVARDLYNAIAVYYAVDLDSFDSHTVIDLAAPIRGQLPGAEVLYPRRLSGCTEETRQ